ncbi:UDP-4-amino-4,6-dideoxy-N-acetyl-beta-L-altrosamine N-acetyltransferase [Paenibacillus sp. N4]|uniref:UDP-4-amino-4, 6-dideoxy-N-acetyl-beta-L-altrosamine N-acetyltransferase n=1 Tax=Paenibacillus vietnamensis TaxID=2590547 RepID=UPI001CD10A52|nr:UDP-4-amino-4,6-dideoxy-N-acetyl-beta-L-altrosamine N-acetyltransferase [Paenibacillus vietnamensis]MCA0754948.1 UDP-4-amino-4,6-dideoxy-N-acetyl-beta-L-altrosamine N-acetyltransferase [Paenibacillus vietnamensis]
MPGHGSYLLRPMKESDLDIVLKWRNSDRIRENMYTDRLITMEEHSLWYATIQHTRASDCSIFEIDGQSMGFINFTGFDPLNQSCHWGFYVGEPQAPRGSGSIMGFLGLEHCFENLLMSKCFGEAFVFNTASIAFHRKLGFREEGSLRKQILKNGRYEEVMTFVLLAEEWFRIKNELRSKIFKV